MKKQDIINGKKFQIIGDFGAGKDYVYQFEKDKSDSNYTYDRVIQYYDLGSTNLTFWETHIMEKLTDNYLTICKLIMNKLVKVRIKLEDITPYESDKPTTQEQSKKGSKEIVK